MHNTTLYALDFDGVICDSALETGLSGWKAAIQIWPDMPTQPPQLLSDQFRLVRPILETGYEAILIMRMLFEGETVANILASFHESKQSVIDSAKMDVGTLKKLFGTTRDAWIENDLDTWLAMNPLFPGMVEKLNQLSQQGIWYILTTKQERFVTQILNANQIMLPEQRIFGMDRNRDKDDVLISLVSDHPEATFLFVEDRLPALLSVKHNQQLQGVGLQLVSWGFNTLQDRQAAEVAGVEVIDLEAFTRL